MRRPISRQGGGFRRLLFLCADNYLASRYCEELFNSRIRGEGLNWQGISRAYVREPGPRPLDSMAPEAVAGLRQRGAAPVNHRRLPLAALPFDFDCSERVIAVMPPTRRMDVVNAWPAQSGRVELLTVVCRDVSTLLDELTGLVDRIVDRLIDAEALKLTPDGDRGRVVISAKLSPLHAADPGSGDGRFDSIQRLGL